MKSDREITARCRNKFYDNHHFAAGRKRNDAPSALSGFSVLDGSQSSDCWTLSSSALLSWRADAAAGPFGILGGSDHGVLAAPLAAAGPGNGGIDLVLPRSDGNDAAAIAVRVHHSAQELGEGYRDRTRLAGTTAALNRMDYTQVRAGDIVVTESGAHTLAYLGDYNWIEADPLAGAVITLQAPAAKNPWFEQPMKILSWREEE